MLMAALMAGSAMAQSQPGAGKAVEDRVESILKQMTLEEKIDYIGGFNDFYVRAVPRLKLPALKMSDGPLGVRNYGAATTLPAGINSAATFDVKLIERLGEVIGKDARARGVHFMLCPGMNIYRSPLNGRNFEYYGEDPFLSSRIAVAEISGIQKHGVSATAKHFVANDSDWDRHHLDSVVDERTLREIYLPPFEASVKEAHVGAIMDSYNLINGQHATQNHHLNVEILKNEWGFKGLVMSDWVALTDGLAAANGGLDLEMPRAQFMTPELIKSALKNGSLSMATLDDKVRRILRVAAAFGWLDHEQTDKTIPLDLPEGHAVSLEASLGGSVLLKNDNVLPLDANKVKTLVVIGPIAKNGAPTAGGSAGVRPFKFVTLLDGLKDKFGDKLNVVYQPGFQNGEEFFNNNKFVTSPNGAPGLIAEFYNHGGFYGEPTIRRVDTKVDYRFIDVQHFGEIIGWVFESNKDLPAHGSFTYNFAARWSGYYKAEKDGDYRFLIAGDGEAKLWIDDAEALNLPATFGDDQIEHVVSLKAGEHKIKLEYKQTDGGADISFGVQPVDNSLLAAAKDAAAKADAVVIYAGFTDATEGEGQDRQYKLPVGQEDLIRAVTAVNPKSIVILNSGGAVATEGWLAQTPAFLHAFYSGQESGHALVKLLFGEVSPSGKLPFTWEKKLSDTSSYASYRDPGKEKHVVYSEGVFTGYRHYDRDGVEPLYPFGFGLSYAKFEYSNLKIAHKSGANYTVSFTVKNVGSVEAAESAQLYIAPPTSAVARPVKELKGFAKFSLKAGESKSYTIELNDRSFQYYDVEKKAWTADAGSYGVFVGSSSRDLRLKSAIQIGK